MNTSAMGRGVAGAALLLATAALSACGSTTTTRATSGGSHGSSGGSSGSGSTGGSGSTTSGGSGGTTGTTGPSSDFAPEPVVLDGLPSTLPALFEGDGGNPTGGPCLSEPTLDALVPRNWTPLHFEWAAASGENVFELKLHVANQTHDQVVYTSQTSYSLDAATWKALAAHSAGQDVEVTLRGATFTGTALTAGPDLGASGTLHLAPVDAPGAVVYWTSSNGSAFKGFTIGDAAPTMVLNPALAGPTSTGSTTSCVACHTSSPDGALVLYTRDGADGTRTLDTRLTADAGLADPSAISPSALQLLGRNRQFAPVLSKAHYAAADAVALSIYQDANAGNVYELIWTNLHATDTSAANWGVLARTGDARQAASPAWRHDGTAVAYVSAPSVGEGVIADRTAADPDYDIYTVPYANGAGGAATPLPGASDPNLHEFYPVYSPDDVLLAFNRTDQPVNSYNQPSAEVCVVPGQGGTAVRLAANDPPACTGLASPGLTNSWARWAPSAEKVGDKRYYWLVFSSKRRPSSAAADGSLLPQLYVAGIVTHVDASGAETFERDYPALYVGSQDPTESNHTPAWDVFQLPFQ